MISINAIYKLFKQAIPNTGAILSSLACIHFDKEKNDIYNKN